MILEEEKCKRQVIKHDDDLHRHAGFDADAVEQRPRLGRNQEFGHMVSVSDWIKNAMGKYSKFLPKS